MKCDCFHKDINDPCKFYQTPYIILFGCLQLVFSQIQDIDRYGCLRNIFLRIFEVCRDADGLLFANACCV